MNPKNFSESDLCDKVIRPAIVGAGWNTLDQIYAQFPLRAGRVVVRGNQAHRDKGSVLFADYALFFKANIPLAIVEAKKSRLSMSAGMQGGPSTTVFDIMWRSSARGRTPRLT